MKQLFKDRYGKYAASLMVLGALVGEISAFAQESDVAAAPAEATEAQPDSDRTLGVVYVSARKREEREIDAPVAISALPAAEIDQRGLSNLSELATAIPELRIAEGTIAYGGNIALRGVSSATSTASIEQAVTVNVDGIPVSYAGIVKLGQFDLGQVEVLKGPQALYFGKNSTGGIISLRSAEPTYEFDYRVRGEYEAESRQYAVESFVSGPLAEGVRGRLAVRYSDSDGWLKNEVPDASVVPGARPPKYGRGPATEETLVRGSLFIDPSEDFQLKLIGGYAEADALGGYLLAQRVYCPYGTAQGPFGWAGQNCKADNVTTNADLNPARNAIDPRFPADGAPYTRTTQQFLVADATYDVTDSITLNSITGYYNVNLDSADNVSSGAVPFVDYATSIEKTSLSQELRLSNDPSGRLSWMLGLFLQDDEFTEDQTTVIGAVRPKATFELTGETFSPFVQLGLGLTDKMKLSAGVRYTEETKQQQITAGPFSGLYPRQLDFENWSPEVTLSYAIGPDANLYASYKEAYKSGGFQTEHVAIPAALTAGTVIDNSFDEELVEGFEVGAKMFLLDGAMRLSTAAFQYEYTDLQLSRFDPVLVANIINNVGAATTKGIEADVQYRPAALSGLTLNGAVAYLDAKYDDYTTGCYNGQTAALGCDLVTRTHSLEGKHLPRAPEWSATFSGVYEGSFNSSLDYRLNAGLKYSSEYETNTDAIVNTQNDSYVAIDAGIAFLTTKRDWEFAVIGRNLTNEYWWASSLQVPVTGNATTFSDIATTMNRGRQVMLRLTYHPQ